jgi:hypothetical protein
MSYEDSRIPSEQEWDFLSPFVFFSPAAAAARGAST